MAGNTFKDELVKEFKSSTQSFIDAQVRIQMPLIKKACIDAARARQGSVDYQLTNDAACTVVGLALQIRIQQELNLYAKHMVDNDRDYCNHYIRINGWVD